MPWCYGTEESFVCSLLHLAMYKGTSPVRECVCVITWKGRVSGLCVCMSECVLCAEVSALYVRRGRQRICHVEKKREREGERETETGVCCDVLGHGC